MNAQTPAAFARGFLTAYMQGMQMQREDARFKAAMERQSLNDLRTQQYREQTLNLQRDRIDASIANNEAANRDRRLRRRETARHNRASEDIAAAKLLFPGKSSSGTGAAKLPTGTKEAIAAIIKKNEGTVQDRWNRAKGLVPGATMEQMEEMQQIFFAESQELTGGEAKLISPDSLETDYNVPVDDQKAINRTAKELSSLVPAEAQRATRNPMLRQETDLQGIAEGWMAARKTVPSTTPQRVAENGPQVDYKGFVADFQEGYELRKTMPKEQLEGYDPFLGNEEEARSAAIREWVEQFKDRAELFADNHKRLSAERGKRLDLQKKALSAKRARDLMEADRQSDQGRINRAIIHQSARPFGNAGFLGY